MILTNNLTRNIICSRKYKNITTVSRFDCEFLLTHYTFCFRIWLWIPAHTLYLLLQDVIVNSCSHTIPSASGMRSCDSTWDPSIIPDHCHGCNTLLCTCHRSQCTVATMCLYLIITIIYFLIPLQCSAKIQNNILVL